jgi:uncharacterized membrane protein YphA (DoxX/SURF4 family)
LFDEFYTIINIKQKIMKKLLNQFLFSTSIGNNKTLNLVYLFFRIHVGLSIAIHAGYPKMKDILAPGWFSEQVASLGFTFPSPQFWAMAASWGEFVGGLMLAFGFLTRIASIQLAFQFLIISFVWYNEPEFLTGMYFQQLYFWCFVFCSAAGGGRLSLDALVMKNKLRLSTNPMVKPALTVFLLLFFTFHSNAQQPAIQQEDVRKLEGSWKGVLTYKDYQNGKEVMIPCNLEVKLKDDMKLVQMAYDYPEERSHNNKDQVRISSNGTRINGEKLIERTVDANGNVKLIIEMRGQDGSRPAIIKQIIEISDSSFILTKVVQYMTDGETVQRNQYRWNK